MNWNLIPRFSTRLRIIAMLESDIITYSIQYYTHLVQKNVSAYIQICGQIDFFSFLFSL